MAKKQKEMIIFYTLLILLLIILLTLCYILKFSYSIIIYYLVFGFIISILIISLFKFKEKILDIVGMQHIHKPVVWLLLPPYFMLVIAFFTMVLSLFQQFSGGGITRVMSTATLFINYIILLRVFNKKYSSSLLNLLIGTLILALFTFMHKMEYGITDLIKNIPQLFFFSLITLLLFIIVLAMENTKFFKKIRQKIK